ncbi:hypothetical protein Tco_1218132 [Tanacetum coccineum]
MDRKNTPHQTNFPKINDQRIGITSITVNGKNAYELKGKFLDDLHKNAFSGTNGEDAKLGSDEVEPTNEKTFDLGETNRDDEQEIGEIINIEANLFDYETPLKFKEFNYLLKIDPDVLTNDIRMEYGKNQVLTKDGYCNGGNLPGAYIVGNTLCYQDLKWYDALKDRELKEEALRNKAIMEGLINEDVESNDEGVREDVANPATSQIHWMTFVPPSGERRDRCEHLKPWG